MAQQQECRLVERLPEGHARRTAYIEGSGKYCLTYDIVQPRIFDTHAGSFKSFGGASLIHFRYPPGRIDVGPYQLDLLGHSIKAEAKNMVGIENWSAGLQISVRNGYIEVPGNRSPNSGVFLRGEGAPLRFGKQEPGQRNYTEMQCWPVNTVCEDTPASESFDGKAPVYKASHYLVENMTIHAGWRGVVMGGGNNVVRNSTLEVDGHTAVYMYGPGSIIEDNTIIIHGKGNAAPFDAPIKLRDAHGAIVRNNRIIYKTWIGKEPAAINLLDSAEVRIEGNTLEHFSELVRVNGESSYAEKDTVMK